MTTGARRRFLLATWEGGGTVAPMITVAQRLAARGHRVRMMCDEASRRDIEEAGMGFEPWTSAPNRPDRTPASEYIRDWDVEGVEAFKRALEAVWAGPALAYAQDLLKALRREPADLVVTCELLLGVAAGCEAARQPHVMLSVLVTLGGSLEAAALRPPANARLVPRAPHGQVMGAASLVVTHGGHGTVLRALAHRLPLLIVPHGRDQADNAARVAERGAGLALPKTAATAALRSALRALLSEATFSEAARRLGSAVAAEAADSPVAGLLEAYASDTPPTDRVLLP